MLIVPIVVLARSGFGVRRGLVSDEILNQIFLGLLFAVNITLMTVLIAALLTRFSV